MPKPSAAPLSPPGYTNRRTDALTGAFLLEMSVAGRDGASARNVAARVGAPASSINYHFGSLERLYDSSQHYALEAARRWLSERLNDARQGGPWPRIALSAFAAATIDDWRKDQNVLAQAEACDIIGFAWRPTKSAELWIRTWEDFWTEALPLFSFAPEDGKLVAPILQSERIGHLAQWRAPYDRAALEEVCRTLTMRLTDEAAPPLEATPWRLGAERLTQTDTIFAPLEGTAQRIAEAVVIAADEQGEKGLTHRAVAAVAGLSLGAVTHYFPTRSALMTAGYACLYTGIIDTARNARVRAPDHADLSRHILAFLEIGRTAPRARALEVFFLSATRDPDLAPFAARVRYSRGASTLNFLKPALPHLTRLDATLISHWISGASRTAAIMPESADVVAETIKSRAGVIFSSKS